MLTYADFQESAIAHSLYPTSVHEHSQDPTVDENASQHVARLTDTLASAARAADYLGAIEARGWRMRTYADVSDVC